MIPILREADTDRAKIFAREDPVDSVAEPVRAILADVKANGDAALKKYTQEFDGVEIATVEVGAGALEEGLRAADPTLVDILYRAAERIAAFHQHQVRNSFLVNDEEGILMGQKVVPLARVGLPMAPRPITPIFLSLISVPANFFFPFSTSFATSGSSRTD